MRKSLKNEEKIDFSKKPEGSFFYAAVFAVAGYLTSANVPDKHLVDIVRFIAASGIAPEYQILFSHHLYSRAGKLFKRLKVLKEFREFAEKSLIGERRGIYRDFHFVTTDRSRTDGRIADADTGNASVLGWVCFCRCVCVFFRQ